MASGYNAARFNLTLACAAAGGSAFALFAMPSAIIEASLDAFGLSAFVAFPIGMAARVVFMAASASLAFGLAWLVLRSCDLPNRQCDDDAKELEDWLPLAFSAQAGGAELAFWNEELDDPFAELARGAEPVVAPLELTREQAEPSKTPSAIDAPDEEGLSTRELLGHLPASRPASPGAFGLIQRLNAGFKESEWPLPSGRGDEEPADADDRLRNVLQDLQVMARGNG